MGSRLIREGSEGRSSKWAEIEQLRDSDFCEVVGKVLRKYRFTELEYGSIIILVTRVYISQVEWLLVLTRFSPGKEWLK